jgi:hypothetical protein
VAGAGCGQSEQEQAREVVQDYVDARNSGEYEAECDLYSEEFKEQLGAADCPAFIEEQTTGADFEQTLELVSVRVKGDRATAELDVAAEGGGTTRVGLILENQDGDWKVTGLQ